MCYDHYYLHTPSTIISARSVCCRALCSTFDFSRSPFCSTNGRTTEILRSQLAPFGSQLPTGGHGVYAHTSRFGVGERSKYSCSMYAHTTKCLSQDLLFIIHHRAVSDECHPPITIDNWAYSVYSRARAGLLRII